MDAAVFKRVQAIHPHWTGILLLSRTSNEVRREGTAVVGSYQLNGRRLDVIWDRYGADGFRDVDGIFYEDHLVEGVMPIEQLDRVLVGSQIAALTKVAITAPRTDHEVTLRLGSEDLADYRRIFVSRAYDSAHLPASAATIVDLEAGIGLASSFLSLRYREARVLAVEGDSRNFELLILNTVKLGERLQRIKGVVEPSNRPKTDRTRVTTAGCARGGVGPDAAAAPSPGLDVKVLLDQARFAQVDLLRLTLGSAGRHLCSDAASDWLARVRMIVIETDDRNLSDCDAAVRTALIVDFEEMPRSSLALMFRRRS